MQSDVATDSRLQGWIAILGAIALLLISGIQNIEELMMKVEWATLLFFGALFILMEGLGELGLIDAIGTATSNAISDFPDESRKVGPVPPPFVLLLVLGGKGFTGKPK